MCVCVRARVVTSEWVGAEKEVAEKVEVKTQQQKATDEGRGQRAERPKTQEKKWRRGRRRAILEGNGGKKEEREVCGRQLRKFCKLNPEGSSLSKWGGGALLFSMCTAGDRIVCIITTTTSCVVVVVVQRELSGRVQLFARPAGSSWCSVRRCCLPSVVVLLGLFADH